MRLNIYISKNSVLKCTGQPRFDDHEPDIVQKQIERQLFTGKEEEVVGAENSYWYHLGTYDDETMRFNIFKEPVLLVDCSAILQERKIRLAIFAKVAEEKAKEDAKESEVK